MVSCGRSQEAKVGLAQARGQVREGRVCGHGTLTISRMMKEVRGFWMPKMRQGCLQGKGPGMVRSLARSEVGMVVLFELSVRKTLEGR